MPLEEIVAKMYKCINTEKSQKSQNDWGQYGIYTIKHAYQTSYDEWIILT